MVALFLPSDRLSLFLFYLSVQECMGEIEKCELSVGGEEKEKLAIY